MSAGANIPRPICFMVMPFGTKDTGVIDGSAPGKVNFDTLWRLALSPAIEELGYTAVRADQDLGALIIKEMVERLTMADLIIADVTIPNANVYYEVGIRHAASEHGCVLIASEWSKPLFDIQQMRRITFPLPATEIDEEQGKKIRAVLVQAVPGMARQKSPTFQLVEGYPRPTAARASAFQDFVKQLSAFQAKVTTARSGPMDRRPADVRALLDQFAGTVEQPLAVPMVPSIAVELVLLARDCLPWTEAKAFIERLPAEIQELPLVKEQHSLVRSNSGEHLEAIGALEELIRFNGDSSERQGLLGGRYKRLYRSATSEREKAVYLSKAIEHYERGMMLDLNDYYPSCNLPRLLRLRNDPGDLERAHSIDQLVIIALERALLRNTTDPWARPTLLGAAFDAQDLFKARELTARVAREGVEVWKLKSTLEDLAATVGLITDAALKKEFAGLIDRLKQLTA